MEYAITGSDIRKKFKGFVLDIPRLDIPQGFATALVGENGAGKTTLMNILSGIRLDYQGQIQYFTEKAGIDDAETRDRIAIPAPEAIICPIGR